MLFRSGWEGREIPDALNGVRMVIGGKLARLLYVSPNQINAQVPADTSAGTQALAVNNGTAASLGLNVTVGAVAPAIFFTPAGGIVVKNADFSLVGPDNPAQAGDVLVIYSTGLGQTTPALTTGVLVPLTPLSNTVPVTVTIGGQNAEIIGSVASPGFAGLYQTAVRMPPGVAAGNRPVILRAGGVDRKSTRLNSSHIQKSRMPSSA